MASDKNTELLEKHLKILGQKIRIDILKRLNNSPKPISYSMLQKEILGTNPNSINFSFHLKSLKKSSLIVSSEVGYTLTLFGKQILKNILAMEQILNVQNKTTMIRTSKYSKEPFNIDKIEKYLIKEGQMEEFQAKQIAQEVEERLSKTNIQYLTTPLMREYINAVLLENGLEKVRHRLTRLGTPPFEVFKLFRNNNIKPDHFLNKLGSDVSEQFLLLNLLPNNLADLYLSGEIALLNLNYWSLRPLGFFITTKSILDFIFHHFSINYKKLEDPNDYISLILHFFDVMNLCKPFLSEDILLGNFNEDFLTLFNFNEKNSFRFKLLITEFIRFNKSSQNRHPHISLDFSFRNLNKLEGDDSSILRNTNDFILNLLQYKCFNNETFFPVILFDHSKTDTFNDNPVIDLVSSSLNRNLIFYKSNLLNSSVINVMANESYTNNIILDKILLNLHAISLQSNQSDDKFYELVQERLTNIFDLFTIKKELMNDKLKLLKQWNTLIEQFFDNNKNNWLNKSIKSISFYGLNEAVKTHCGIELDRIETSEKFALRIISLIKDIIDEKAQEEQDNYIFSQPHNDNYLFNSLYRNNDHLDKNFRSYSSNIIRGDSKLPIEKKISLFKKFENLLKGGTLFRYNLNKMEISLKKILNLLNKSELKAFSIN